MLELKIRRYIPSDNNRVWELHILGLNQNGITNVGRDDPWARDLNNIEKIYLKEGDFILGEVEGKVVATGAFKKRSEEVAEVKRMRVDPEYQRRGFGQAILKELEKRVIERGYKKMVLDTSENWTKARNLYEKNGYKEIGRKIRSLRYHAVFYEKDLI